MRFWKDAQGSPAADGKPLRGNSQHVNSPTGLNSTSVPTGITRREFVAGAACAVGATAFALLAPDSLPLFGPQTAYATTGTDVSERMHNHVFRIRPQGFFRTAGVHNDGAIIGNVCWLYALSTSSKQLVRYDSGRGGCSIRALSNFEENGYVTSSVWDIDDASKKSGAVVHTWGSDPDKASRTWRFYRQDDGCYLIQNCNSNLYLSLANTSNDGNENKLIQSNDGMLWELEPTGHGLDGNDSTSVDYWVNFSSYPDGPCWMSKLDGETRLCDISIPGTHDTGTCSVDNDLPPNSSLTKTQQDYLIAQLLEGVRYFDLRLGDESDPVIKHGIMTTLNKKNNEQHFSEMIDVFSTFLSQDASKNETIIALVSGTDAEVATNACASEMSDASNQDMFYFYDETYPAPKLKDVRGKIVVMHRFEAKGTNASFPLGLYLEGWDDFDYPGTKGLVKIYDKSFTGTQPLVQAPGESGDAGSAERDFTTQVWVQDNYSTNATKKLDYVEASLEQAAGLKGGTTDGHDDCRWVINYSSCTQNNPFTAARNMNEKLYGNSYLSGDKSSEFIGILVSDFTDASLCRMVYQRNFPDAADAVGVVPYALPDSLTLTYGDSLKDAVASGGKVLGAGYYRLVDEGEVLDVASSGALFEIAYVQVSEDGTEKETGLAGEVPITVNPRTVTVEFSGLEGLAAGADVRSAAKALLQNLIDGDDCTPQLRFFRDEGGAPGAEIAADEGFSAGSYWVSVAGLSGAQAGNYVLAGNAAVLFTVAAAADVAQQAAGSEAAASAASASGTAASRSASGAKTTTASDSASNNGTKSTLPNTGDDLAVPLAATAATLTAAGAVAAALGLSVRDQDI